MEYILIGQEGKEYGPYGIELLQQWRDDGSLTRDTELKNFVTGQIIEARAIPELYEPVSGISSPSMSSVMADEGPGVLLYAIGYSALALALFFLLKGYGILIAGYAMYRAFGAKQQGSKWGTAALAVTGATVVIIGIGWLMRMKGGS